MQDVVRQPILIALETLAALTSLAVWVVVAARAGRRQPIVAFEPRRPVPWRLVDLALVALVDLALYDLSLRAVLPQGVDPASTSATAAMLLAGSVANVAAVVFAVGLIKLRARGTWADLGLKAQTWRYDVALGLLAFAAVSVPVYAMQWALNQWFPTRHPIVDLLRTSPELGLVVVGGLSALVVAPVAEEFLFRVLLQGWLESLELPSPQRADWLLPGARAIVTSSLVFALLHLGHGPDPIPLFFLALALGYLYQRTHRLLPCVVVHFSVNACSLLVLWSEVAGGA